MNIVAYYLFYIYSVHVNVGPENNLFVNIEQYISPSEKKKALSEKETVTNVCLLSKLPQVHHYYVICTL